MKPKVIIAWDRRKCANCQRTRVHFANKQGWHCIGLLEQALDIVVACGKRREPLV